MSALAWVVTICGAILAVAAVARLVKRPVKWLWQQNVVEPFTHWHRTQIREVVNDELDRRPLTNGWGTKTLHEVAKAVDADVDEPKANRAEGP